MPSPDDWLPTSEVAKLLGVSSRTLNYMVRKGQGPPYRRLEPNMHPRFRRADVEAYCRAKTFSLPPLAEGAEA